VGSQLYIHRAYADLTKVLFPYPVLIWAASLFECLPDRFEYNCLCLGLHHKDVRFDEAPDFNDAREPHVGRWLRVSCSGKVTQGHSDMIWHHKWLWVRPEHAGFDVEKSRRWSARYSPLIAGAPSGSARVFAAQLRAAGVS
jgi:hypothetical protein